MTATNAALITIGAIGCQPQGTETEKASQPSAKTEEKPASPSPMPVAEEPVAVKAIAVLYPTDANAVQGTVQFTEENGKIRVVADVERLQPGKHGFHVHQYGNCSAADGSSAGGHFNPDGKAHGSPDSAERHVGDLGNIEADEQGKARLDSQDNELALSGSHSIVGRSVVVHAGEDDLTSQPSGNAGARVACGVVGIAE